MPHLFPFLRFIYLFLERGEGREKERERNINASHVSPAGDLACNPDMFPDWESNWGPFGSQAGVQSTEPHQLGLICFLLSIMCLIYNIAGDHKFFLKPVHTTPYIFPELPEGGL